MAATTVLNYLPRKSPVHALTGATKLAFFLLFTFASMVTYDTRVLVVLMVFSFAAFRLSRIRIREVRFMLVFMLVFLLLNNFFIYLFDPDQGSKIYETRHVLLHIAGRYDVTSEQLFYMLNISLKYFVALPVAILFISATNPSEFAASLVEGFKAMVPAILILTLAWTLSGVCGEDYLNAGGFVSQVVNGNQMAHTLMPGIFFLIALGLAFATGTSWGTFGILIPITIAIFGDMGGQVMVLTVAAVLAGAVCGDHISPISDTTILASTGANCNHIEHVSTQMPYALLVAACCLIGYLVAGFTSNGWLGLGVGFVLLMAALIVLLARFKKQKGAEASQAAGK